MATGTNQAEQQRRAGARERRLAARAHRQALERQLRARIAQFQRSRSK